MKKIFPLILSVFILASCTNTKEEAKNENKLLLPVIGPKVAKAAGDTIYHTVGDFSLLDQDKQTITQKTTDGKLYVANFFFATCQSICPAMSTQLVRVQAAEKGKNDFLILSHTVNPMHDTAEVLNEYAGRYGADKNTWHFLTGTKTAIYDLAKKDYLVNAVEDDGTAEGFIHSETFLLIDRQKRIRGIYDGTDSLQVNKLISDIDILRQEK